LSVAPTDGVLAYTVTSEVFGLPDLWAAIEAAGAELAAAQGPDPSAWRADAGRERITFLPGVLPYTMRYTNRPTGIQQVIEFRGHRPGR
ncbi:MAG: hypothetical protein ACRDL0_06880, partial [Thermoleophilaceae bacterium]